MEFSVERREGAHDAKETGFAAAAGAGEEEERCFGTAGGAVEVPVDQNGQREADEESDEDGGEGGREGPGEPVSEGVLGDHCEWICLMSSGDGKYQSLVY